MSHRRRACLSVPGSSEKMLGKARDLAVDEIVLDLEDAVAPGDKDRARELVCSAVRQDGWACGTIAVRVNGPGTAWWLDDLAALRSVREALGSVVVPKVEDARDLGVPDFPIQALIESPAGLLAAPEVAAAPRVEALILGYADLGAALGRSPEAARDLDLWAPAQHQLLVAARAAGVQAIDGPWLGTADDEPFRASAGRAAALGFDGKWAIHPQQTAFLTEAFTPTEDEVAWARRVLDALDGSAGAVAVDGQMVDEAVAVAARRILVRAG